MVRTQTFEHSTYVEVTDMRLIYLISWILQYTVCSSIQVFTCRLPGHAGEYVTCTGSCSCRSSDRSRTCSGPRAQSGASSGDHSSPTSWRTVEHTHGKPLLKMRTFITVICNSSDILLIVLIYRLLIIHDRCVPQLECMSWHNGM